MSVRHHLEKVLSNVFSISESTTLFYIFIVLTQIYNGIILTSDGHWLKNGSIILSDDKIIDICDCPQISENVDKHIDAQKGYVLPGCIDLHVHGASGYDFMDGTEKAFEKVIQTHRRHGTTSLYPTIASASFETMQIAGDICNDLILDKKSGVLGLHFEGPYFNPAMVGGQLPEFVRPASKEEYVDLICNFKSIARWDAAPETSGALDFGKYASSQGILVGIAHTQADYTDVLKAFENGYSHATHFYNAMTGIHKEGIYKKGGTVEAIFLIDGISVEVIADGVHVPPEVLKLIYKFKGRENMCFVTDSLAITDADDSFYPRVMIENGVCKLRDGSAIAGSCSTMDRLIRTAVLKAEIPLEDAARMASETPAKIMDVFDRKGSLSKGKDADIIILDNELNLTNVIAMGEEINL